MTDNVVQQISTEFRRMLDEMANHASISCIDSAIAICRTVEGLRGIPPYCSTALRDFRDLMADDPRHSVGNTAKTGSLIESGPADGTA